MVSGKLWEYEGRSQLFIECGCLPHSRYLSILESTCAEQDWTITRDGLKGELEKGDTRFSFRYSEDILLAPINRGSEDIGSLIHATEENIKVFLSYKDVSN